MKKEVWRILSIFFLVAGIFSFILAVHFYQESLLFTQWTTFYSEEGPRTASSYEKMKKKEDEDPENALPFALWKSESKQVIANDLSKLEKEITALLIVGDFRTILPISETLAVNDVNGCLLDRSTGIELFGSDPPMGVSIKWKNKDYIVRGYFSSPYPLILFSPSLENDEPLPYISVKSINGSNFAERQGLQQSESFSGKALQKESLFYLLLPLFLFILYFLYTWILKYKKIKNYPMQWIFWILFFFLGLISLSLGILYFLPNTFFPSQWANFAFWKTANHTWTEQLAWQQTFSKGIPYSISKQFTHRSLFSLLASIFVLVSGKSFEKLMEIEKK